jgi:hypothetical protein
MQSEKFIMSSEKTDNRRLVELRVAKNQMLGIYVS